MLPIRCGIESEDTDLKLDRDWPVLAAKFNSSIESSALLKQFQKENQIHIFTSQSALFFASKHIESTNTSHVDVSSQSHSTVVGVGATTDAAARNFQAKFPHFYLKAADLSANGKRENGLHWTLERLEHMGHIPRQDVVLWTKSWSISEKILNDFRHSRQWQSWSTTTVEVYQIEPSARSLPISAVTAIAQQQSVCFSVKSAEVLDATVAALLSHMQKATARDLPENIHFSVWEKSALARAQQLYLQSRLIPAHEFEAAMNNRDSNE